MAFDTTTTLMQLPTVFLPVLAYRPQLEVREGSSTTTSVSVY